MWVHNKHYLQINAPGVYSDIQLYNISADKSIANQQKETKNNKQKKGFLK